MIWAETAPGQATKTKPSINEAGPKVLETVSRAAHAGAYVLAYGATYAAMFSLQLMSHHPVPRPSSRSSVKAAQRIAFLLGRAA